MYIIRQFFISITISFFPFLIFTNIYGQDRGVEITEVNDTQGETLLLYKESHALIIGVSDYTRGWPDLQGVKKDVRFVHEALENNGFHVVTVENPDSKQLSEAFKSFIFKYGLDPGNRLLFYFAGHGHTLKAAYGEEMGYIVPSDTPNPYNNKNGFLKKAMSMQEIEVYAKQIQSKHAMFMFDACFSGSIFAISRAVPQIINYKTSNPVRQFITSGSADEEVPDKSIFRDQFVEALEGYADLNKDGYVTGTELGEFLQEKVVNYSRGSQHPQHGKIRNPNLDKGDFVFVVTKAEKKAPYIIRVSADQSDAEVWAHGKLIGKAPANIEAHEEGTTFKVEVKKEGYLSYSEKVTTTQKGVYRLDVELAKSGRLLIGSKPEGAVIYLDDKQIGKTPFEITQIPLGAHNVRIEKDLYEPFSQTFTLASQQAFNLSPTLKRKTSNLIITSNPEGANIYINGNFIGTSPLPQKTFTHGNYKIEMKKKGFYSTGKNISIDERSSSVSFTLQPKSRNKALLNSLVFPGMGQFYSGNTKRGLLYILSETAAIGSIAYISQSYSEKKDQYDTDRMAYQNARSLEEITDTRKAMRNSYNDVNSKKTQLLTIGSIAAGLWIWNVMDSVIFFPDISSDSHSDNRSNIKIKPESIDKGIVLSFIVHF